jgi:hypothetical protein
MHFYQAFLTAVLTLIGAVILFFISELARGLAIQPMIELRKLIGLTVDRVIFHSATLTNPGPIMKVRADKISDELRSLATELRAKRFTIVWYGLFAHIGLVPNENSLKDASGKLTGLSNSFTYSVLPSKDGAPMVGVDFEMNLVYIFDLQGALGFPKAILDVDEALIRKREQRANDEPDVD